MSASPLSEPWILARAKRHLFPDHEEDDAYAVVDTQFGQEEWLDGEPIPADVREALAPFNHVRLGAGYPDLVGVRRLPSDVLEMPSRVDQPPLVALEAKGHTSDGSVDVSTGLVQARDRLQEANATYVVAPRGAISSSANRLAAELNVGLLGVEADGAVETIQVPQAVGASGTRETDAIRFQASTGAAVEQSFSLNHPKNYLAYPIARYADGDTQALIEEHVVGAVQGAKRGAVFLGLIDDRGYRTELTPLGMEVVRFALDWYGSIDRVWAEFEGWKRSRQRFYDLDPAWGQLTRRVVWNYPATQVIIEALQAIHREWKPDPTLVDLVEWLHGRHPTFAVELFIRGDSIVRGQVLNEVGDLQVAALENGCVYHSPTVFQLKAMLYHAGIVADRGAEPSRLEPESDRWRLRQALDTISR